MPCLPQQPMPIGMRVVAFLLSIIGLGLLVAFYLHPTWTEFRRNGQKGTLGLRQMCVYEEEDRLDCRDIEGQDILFVFFKLFSTVGLIAYGIFVVVISMTFCSCCITSDKAKGITKFFVVVTDLITFNCLMIAIATGLKSEFLGTLKISDGCIFCLVAFSISVLLCPVYLIDAKNFATQYKKEKKYSKFSNIQDEPNSIEEKTEQESISRPKLFEKQIDSEYASISTHM